METKRIAYFDIIPESIEYVSKNFVRMLPYLGLYLLLSVFSTVFMYTNLNKLYTPMGVPTATFWLMYLFMMVSGMYISISFISHVYEGVKGNAITFGDALSGAWKLVFKSFASYFVMIMIVVIGMLIFGFLATIIGMILMKIPVFGILIMILGGISITVILYSYLAIIMMFLTFEIIETDSVVANPFQIINKFKGNIARLIGTYILISIVTIVPILIIQGITGIYNTDIASGSINMAKMIPGLIIMTVLQLIITAVITVFNAMVYHAINGSNTDMKLEELNLDF